MRTAAHMWLVTRLGPLDDDHHEAVTPTKSAAKGWVKAVDPTLLFHGDDGTGYFVARTPESSDWVARYAIEKVPFHITP